MRSITILEPQTCNSDKTNGPFEKIVLVVVIVNVFGILIFITTKRRTSMMNERKSHTHDIRRYSSLFWRNQAMNNEHSHRVSQAVFPTFYFEIINSMCTINDCQREFISISYTVGQVYLSQVFPAKVSEFRNAENWIGCSDIRTYHQRKF